MAQILSVRGKTPQLGPNCFIASNATLVGDIEMGADCSIWFNAVVRGDVNFIKMGDKVNIQDGACIHCTFEKCGTTIGNSVSIGHHAIVHGCTLEDNVLIGMGAIVMDHAVIGHHSIIAAGAVVSENTIVEPFSIYAGVPARRIKEISAEQRKLLDELPDRYVMYSTWFN